MDYPDALKVCAEAAVRDYSMPSAHAQYEHDQLAWLTPTTLHRNEEVTVIHT